MIDAVKIYEEKYGVKITISIENEPMGTAGPIKLAEEIIRKDNDSNTLFVFNSDISC